MLEFFIFYVTIVSEEFMDYPILSNFNGKNEIVSPQSFAAHVPGEFREIENVKSKGIHKAFFIFYDNPDNNDFLNKLNVVFLFHAGSTTTKVFEYKNSLIAISPLGGPAAASLMEELSVFGIDEFVAIGSAGCLDNNLKNKMVLVDKAIRDEGLSYHYLAPATYVATDADLNKRLEKFLNDNKFEYIKAITWRNDAYYRETAEKVEMAKGLGAVAVEMECASWCAVAKYRGFKFSQLLYFSDSVQNGGWEMYLSKHEGYYSGKREIIIEVVKDMIDKNL